MTLQSFLLSSQRPQDHVLADGASWLLLQLSCPPGSEDVEAVYALVEPTLQQVSCPHSIACRLCSMHRAV